TSLSIASFIIGLRGSSERKGVGMHAGIEEFDFESAFLHGAVLADQLIQTVAVHLAAAVGRYITACRCTRGLPIDAYREAHRLARVPWRQHQMQVTRMETECDATTGLLQLRVFLTHGPTPVQRPLIEFQCGRYAIVRGTSGIQ